MVGAIGSSVVRRPRNHRPAASRSARVQIEGSQPSLPTDFIVPTELYMVERPPDRTNHVPKKQRQTLFRVGHYVHRGYGDAFRWVVYFRVYGPVKAGFDGSWKPGDFEEVK